MQNKKKKQQLFEEEEYIFVQASMYNLPLKQVTAPIGIEIPNPIYTSDTQVCLIVSRNRRRYKEMLQNGGLPGCIKKILDVGKLQTLFRSYASRRKLLHSYDVFLADKRIPRGKVAALLGKAFYATKKNPAFVDVGGSKAMQSIQNAMEGTFLRVGTGNTIAVRAALAEQTVDQIVANVMAVGKALSEMAEIGVANGVVGGNLQSVFVKKGNSGASLQIAASLPPAAPTEAEKMETEKKMAELRDDVGLLEIDEENMDADEIEDIKNLNEILMATSSQNVHKYRNKKVKFEMDEEMYPDLDEEEDVEEGKDYRDEV